MGEPSGILRAPEELGSATRQSGDLTFTDYVRGLEPGEAPAQEVFDLLCQRLRGVLVLELKRRALWHLSPRCLGIFGPATWQEPGAIDELVADCYCFVFLKRLSTLRAHLRIKPNVDGLVFRSIHNYLYDTQKKHDPLGFRIFSLLQLAIRRCCDDGRLIVLAGDDRVRNDTVLGFDTNADPAAQPQRELREQVAMWNDELLPELVTARGKKLDLLVEGLAGRIAKLRFAGVEAFAFAHVLAPFKDDARRRWNVLDTPPEGWSRIEDRPGELERPVLPVMDFEQREAFEWLARCVGQRIEGLKEAPVTLERLRRLWAFLRHQATEDADGKPASRRRIARLLNIPRDSLPRLYSTLGRLTRVCQGRARGSRLSSEDRR